LIIAALWILCRTTAIDIILVGRVARKIPAVLQEAADSELMALTRKFRYVHFSHYPDGIYSFLIFFLAELIKGVLICRVQGKLQFFNSGGFRNAIQELKRDQKKLLRSEHKKGWTIIIDFISCTEIDTAGMQTLKVCHFYSCLGHCGGLSAKRPCYLYRRPTRFPSSALL
jgi:MFS superfamily sulfate permease-like transporter